MKISKVDFDRHHDLLVMAVSSSYEMRKELIDKEKTIQKLTKQNKRLISKLYKLNRHL
jgi:predicted GIY-YIG superfamily endonuclease